VNAPRRETGEPLAPDLLAPGFAHHRLLRRRPKQPRRHRRRSTMPAEIGAREGAIRRRGAARGRIDIHRYSE